jgi:hypothetical protein
MTTSAAGKVGALAMAVAVTALFTGCGQSAEEPMTGMEAVESMAFSEIGYDADAMELTVVFKENGLTYVYQGVPADVYEGLQAAESKGAYYHENIREQFEFVTP